MKLLVIFLILLILGLYFFTDATKGLMKVTGKATWTAANGIVKAVADSNEYKEIKQDIKNKTEEKISELKVKK